MAKLKVIRNSESPDLTGSDVSGVVASGNGDRAQLASGQIDAAAFLDLQVERATAHLEGAASPDLLRSMREMLRLQLELDPVLSGLAQRAMATG